MNGSSLGSASPFVALRCGLLVAAAALPGACGGCDRGKPDRTDAGRGAAAKRSARAGPASRIGERAARQTIAKVRQPAAAGGFYPSDKDKLTRMIDRFLAGVDAERVADLRALISPHAGYVYSGPTAAFAYKQLVDRDIDRAIVLAPSHFTRFDGASLPDADAYRTPLGLVPISPAADELAKAEPFVRNPTILRRRSDLDTTPHTREHSLEVQLPFLQRVLGEFQLVPIVYGEVDPKAVADRIAPLLDGRTIVIASSDLSHYLPYKSAMAKDGRCINAIRALDPDGIEADQACGRGPIRTVIHLARRYGWKVKLLDYRNSGDTAGDRRQVVGYAAIAFYGGQR